METDLGDFTECDPINLRSFLAEWLSVLIEDEAAPRSTLSLFECARKQMCVRPDLPIPQDLFDELETVCGPETLKEFVDDSLTYLGAVSNDTCLNALKSQKTELRLRRNDPHYRKKVMEKMKYRHRDGPWKHHEYNKEPAVDRILVSQPDILLTVQVYRAYVKPRVLKMEQEFEVLGQQGLTELRDVIHCLSDYTRIGDFSRDPDLSGDVIAKDLYKSGFFFVDGVFYNDMRTKDCRDYSRVIIDWSGDSKRSVGPFSSGRMETTKFIDLTVKLGQPYLYVHQGSCEHLIIFSDVRILHGDDCQFLDRYPMQIFKSRERKPNCRVCQNYCAVWVTFGSPLSPEDPCFFCDTCFRALHYTSDGMVLVKNLQVFPYPHVKA